MDNDSDKELISVEVAYATPDKQKIAQLRVEQGCSAREAVVKSNLVADFPEFDPQSAPLGIFGNALGVRGLPPAEEYLLQEGDRVEIYRPLIVDPKEVRRKRAAEAQARREQSGKDNDDNQG